MATLKSLKQIRDVGGIVSKVPLKRNIKWTTFDLSTEQDVEYDADIYIVKPGAGSMVEIFNDNDREQVSLCLSKTVQLENEKGKPEFLSFEDAYQLDPPLRAAMWDEVKVVAGLTRKNSAPSTSSGASSSPSAESAAAP